MSLKFYIFEIIMRALTKLTFLIFSIIKTVIFYKLRTKVIKMVNIKFHSE